MNLFGLNIINVIFFPTSQLVQLYSIGRKNTYIIQVFRTDCTHVTRNCFVLQVKQEADEVICIKQEPEDEQELMSTLLDCQMQQPHHSESQVHLVSIHPSIL